MGPKPVVSWLNFSEDLFKVYSAWCAVSAISADVHVVDACTLTSLFCLSPHRAALNPEPFQRFCRALSSFELIFRPGGSLRNVDPRHARMATLCNDLDYSRNYPRAPVSIPVRYTLHGPPTLIQWCNNSIRGHYYKQHDLL